MKIKTISSSFLRMSIPVLFMTLPGMSSAQENYPITFDFGTDQDKTTYSDAGFTAASDNGVGIENNANNVSINNKSTSLRTGGITRTFPGLGNGARRGFSITSRFQMIHYQSWAGGGWRPGSVLLFANSSSVNDMNNSGLAVQLRSTGTAQSNSTLFQITNGITGTILTSAPFPDHLQHPDRLEITVDVSFSGTNDMLVEATLTHLDENVSLQISHFFEDSADTYIGGTHFGFGARIREGASWRDRGGEVAVESFSVDIKRATLILLSSHYTDPMGQNQPGL